MNQNNTRRHSPVRSTFPGFVGNLLMAVSAIGASAQSAYLEQELQRVQIDLAGLASSKRDRRRQRFDQLARKWRHETQWLSSTTDIAMHPAYQAIIGMGPDALPMILSDLEANSGYWFWALKAISNEDPVPSSNRGAIKKMRTAWLRWGKEKGL